jgi:hypothetical protein
MCNWGYSTTTIGTFNWTRVQGSRGSQIAGPIDYDNTYGNSEGWYLFANIAGKKSFDSATIETKLSTAGLKCMQFYYYLYGNSKFNLNVYVKSFEQITLPAWSRNNSQGNLWRLARVTVGSNNDYKILIEIANIYGGVLGDKIGIDDIYFSNGTCQDSSELNMVNLF